MKLFHVIATSVLGTAMALGTGFALANKQNARQAMAGSQTVTFTTSDFESATNEAFAATKSNITFSVSNGTVATELRVFKNSTLTLSGNSLNVEAITKVEFTCTASDTTKYGPGCFGELDGYSYSGTKGTWTGSSLEVVLTAETNQVRITTLTVTYSEREASSQKATSVTINGLGSSTKDGQIVEDTLQLSAAVAVDSGTSDNIVAWESSNTSVATIDANGKVKYVGNGTTTIKATSHYDAATTNSNVGSVSLTLSNLKGLLSKPLTTSETRALIDGTHSDSYYYYTSGKIVSVGSSISSGKLSFVISDDGSNTNTITVYNCKYLENADFTSVSQIEAGDDVVVHGQIKLYSSTYETCYGYIDSLKSNTVKLNVDKDSATFNIGETTTITATLTNATDVENIAWSTKSGNENIISLSTSSGSSVTVTGVTNGTDSVYCTYGLLQKEITITVKKVHVPTTETFGKYAGAITEGDYIITYSSGAMNTTVSSQRLQITNVSPVDNQITTDDSDIKWHIAKDGDYWTIYNDKEEFYAASTGVANKITTETSVTDNSRWTVTGNDTYDFTNKANAAGSVNATLRRNGSYGFACYNTGTGGELTLYKKDFSPVAKTLQSLRVEGEPTKKSYVHGDSFEPNGLTIYAVFTNSSVFPDEDVTSSVVWTPNPLTNGTTSVTGTYSFDEVEKTCTVSGLTVVLPEKTVIDKVLTADGLKIAASYADKTDPGTYSMDGVEYSVFYLCKTNGIQFHKNDGYITNKEVLGNTSNNAIKTVTLFMNSNNGNQPVVYEGTSTKPDSTVVSPSTTFDNKGINKYVFNGTSTYFTVFASSAGAVNIDRIVVELVDSASSALAEARTAAGKILTGLNGLCGEGGTGVVTQSQWESLCSSVGTLSSDAKQLLLKSHRCEIDDLALDVAKIENAMYHYDSIISKFGYEDLLEVSDIQLSNSLSDKETTLEKKEIATIIIVTASIAVISLTGFFLVLRKRKHQ